MKWTTYDGTEATLPPVGQEVLLRLEPPFNRVEIASRGESKGCRCWNGREGFRIFKPGQSWALIPTEAECAAWERLRSWAKHEVESHGESCECAICKALAALLKRGGGE